MRRGGGRGGRGRGGRNPNEADPLTVALKISASQMFNCNEDEVYVFLNVSDPFNPGNVLDVAICKKDGVFNGAMLIGCVNKEEVQQIVYSTPTIKPLSETLDSLKLKEKAKYYYLTNKWNGENIAFFKYYDINTKVYISARSRGFPFISDTSRLPYVTLVKQALGNDIPSGGASYLTEKNLPPHLRELTNPDIQSITFELCGSLIPQLVTYAFPLQLIPLFSTDHGGRIYPLLKRTHELPADQPLLDRVVELLADIGPDSYDLGTIKKLTETYRMNALLLNEDYRRSNNLQAGYCFNNFLVEGKVLYLLGDDQFSISRESIFKIKPVDIELSHSVKFDSSLMLKALESLSKIYSKGLTLNEKSLRSEMNMPELIWQTFSKDIMELIKGVPNIHSSTVSEQKMLIFVGVPGSGKSTVAHQFVKKNSNWVRVNQDDLKSRKACEIFTRDSLKKGKSIIIDRCNFDISQRNVWVKIASEFNVTDIRCIQFKIPLEVCKQRIIVREDHPTIPKGDSGISIIDNFHQILVNPSPWEGFTEIHSVANDEEIATITEKLRNLAPDSSLLSGGSSNKSPAKSKKPRDKVDPGAKLSTDSSSGPYENKSNSGGGWGSYFSYLGLDSQ